MTRTRIDLCVRFILGFIATCIYLLPLFWMVTTSLKPVEEIFQKPPVLFPSTIQVDSYKQILGLPTGRQEIYINAGLYLRNFLLFLLVAQMLPAVLLVIPLFVMFSNFGINNQYSSVILADTALALPFAIIILRTSFLQIPSEIEEAAWIDGGSRLQVLFNIILPLVRAGLVAVSVFSFLVAWGEFVFALSFLQNPELHPISIGVFQFIGMYKSNYDSMMAFSTLVSIPAVVAFLFLQRQFISGMTSGSVK
jgi:multiple sugar transport system permease protein